MCGGLLLIGSVTAATSVDDQSVRYFDICANHSVFVGARLLFKCVRNESENEKQLINDGRVEM